MSALLGLIFVIAIGATWLAAIRYVRYRKDSVIRRRPSMTVDLIYSTYYADSGLVKEDVVELWSEIANVLRIPRENLRPADRFGTDIGWWQITSEDLDTLSEKATKRAGKLGVAIDPSRISTVDEYVRALARRL